MCVSHWLDDWMGSETSLVCCSAREHIVNTSIHSHTRQQNNTGFSMKQRIYVANHAQILLTRTLTFSCNNGSRGLQDGSTSLAAMIMSSWRKSIRPFLLVSVYSLVQVCARIMSHTWFFYGDRFCRTYVLLKYNKVTQYLRLLLLLILNVYVTVRFALLSSCTGDDRLLPVVCPNLISFIVRLVAEPWFNFRKCHITT